ncbi:MAG: hypothetical protein BAJALOKI1v1_30008 [Promethearchaeota archaeon]|nr:MAG: hypothetical protein BAJALOKI1v1_30008 [Candidatus Lokiarchaeota archaeon]
MVKGLAIFSWDQKIGPVLEVKYPETLELSPNLVNRIYMTHAYSQQFEKEEFIEIKFDNNTIYSYCDKARVKKVGYEILILIIDRDEKINRTKLEQHFLILGKTVFTKPKEQRKDYLLQNVNIVYKKPSAQKVVLLGRAGTGKTSIKKIIFEGYTPKDLLYNPLEPTRGITPSVYTWLDLKLGLFDTSGQELSDLLNPDNENEQRIAFENADILIYLLDYPLWVNKKETLYEDLNRIKEILQLSEEKTRLMVFLHKIDLIEPTERKETLTRIRSELMSSLRETPLYFTSIYPNLIYNLYNAFYEMLSTFTKETQFIKKMLDDMLSEHRNIMCFITNNNNTIIVQTMDKEFEVGLINHIHQMIAQLNQSVENMIEKDNIDHLIISTAHNLNIIMSNVNLSKFNLKNVVIISKSLSANKLILLTGKIRARLNSFYM